MTWRTRKRGTARQIGKKFPIIQKKHLPKLNIPKELMSAQASEKMKSKIGYSIPSKIDAHGPAVRINGTPIRIKKDSLDWLEADAKKRGVPFKIVLMAPQEALRRSPSMVTAEAPAIMQASSQFHKGSITYTKREIKAGRPLDIMFFDYSRMKATYPTHDLRHRARAALELGIKLIPVAILGEKEVKASVKEVS